MSDRPTTEPRPFYDGPVCSRCGHEPHDDRPDPRCGEIVGGWDQPMPTPDYCGCADVDALYGRLVRAEAAQGAAPRAEGLDVERLKVMTEDRLVPYYGPLGEPEPETHMRRCIACGRTSKIVPVTDSASVKHEPDCAVLAVLNDLILSRPSDERVP